MFVLELHTIELTRIVSKIHLNTCAKMRKLFTAQMLYHTGLEMQFLEKKSFTAKMYD